MHHFGAIIFDMDGLLLDTERVHLDTFNASCLELGLGDLSELYKQCIGRDYPSTRDILQKGLQKHIDYEAFCVVWQHYYDRETHNGCVPLKAGAIDLLNAIKNVKTPMAVATSTAHDQALQRLQSAGIAHYFDHVIGGDQVKQGKPNPEIYLQAASLLGYPPAQCLALEDSHNGVIAALTAGMTVVQIPDLVEPDDTLLAMGHIVLENLSAVLGYPFRG